MASHFRVTSFRRHSANGDRCLMPTQGLAAVATIASPDTILRWYRELAVKKYDGSQQRGQGRPKTAAEIAALVVRMAKENERRGYTRIMGAFERARSGFGTRRSEGNLGIAHRRLGGHHHGGALDPRFGRTLRSLIAVPAMV